MAAARLGRRRFVDIVSSGKFRPGLLSLHRVDVSKHLLYPPSSSSSASHSNAPPATMSVFEEQLPAPCAVFSDGTAATWTAFNYNNVYNYKVRTSSAAFFSHLISPRSRSSDGSSSSRILFTNVAGDSMLYDADGEGSGSGSGSPTTMPSLEDFAGPIAASFSVVDATKEEEEESMLYVMHGVRAGVPPRFHVLRFGTPPATTTIGRRRRRWYWQALPPPPFVISDHGESVGSYYTVVDGGGRTIICVSSVPYPYTDAGTWCFDTARGEWWRAGDWVMPFYGRAEYLAGLDHCLGFSSDDASSTRAELWISSLSAMAAMNDDDNQPPESPELLQRLWRSHTPKAKKVELINLGGSGSGSGSFFFAIASVFYLDDGYTSDYCSCMEGDDEYLEITGVEIRPRQPRSSSDNGLALELIPHKSIGYQCDTHLIHQVL